MLRRLLPAGRLRAVSAVRRIHRYFSPLGMILMAGEGEAVAGLWFQGQKRFGAGLDGTEKEMPLPAFDAADRWLERYFAGTEPGAPPPLLLAGTAFSRAVWAELLLIPYGQTATYGEIAARLGAGRAASRAVGAAVGRNPISLMVPCHRVIGADGAMTGYAGGLERKKWLLALEKDGARKKG